MTTDLWLVVHHHQFGFTAGLVESDHEPGDDEVIRALDLNYNADPLYEESIEIIRIDRAEIKTLPLTHQR